MLELMYERGQVIYYVFEIHAGLFGFSSVCLCSLCQVLRCGLFAAKSDAGHRNLVTSVDSARAGQPEGNQPKQKRQVVGPYSSVRVRNTRFAAVSRFVSSRTGANRRFAGTETPLPAAFNRPDTSQTFGRHQQMLFNPQ